MLGVQERQIGERGHVYIVAQLGALVGLRASVRLSKILGKSVGSTLAGSSASKISELGFREAGQMMLEVTDLVTEDELEHFVRLFMPTTRVRLSDGKTPMLGDIFDTHFAGHYGELLGWLSFCLEVNYADFFGVLAKAKAAMRAAFAAQDSTEPSASPSPSPNT